MPLRIAILGSTRGTVMLPIIQAIHEKKLSAEIVCVISNKMDALILEKARTHHICELFIDPKNLTREKYDKKILGVLGLRKIDLILLIGYMRILSPVFISEYRNKIINIHPSLLPAFAGGMDKNVHEAVLQAGVKETGCTVHYVTEAVDAGEIILQKRCQVFANDTAESLKNRVQKREGEALVEACQQFHLLIKNP